MECKGCGVCCKLFIINLNEEEYYSGRYSTEFEDFGITQDFSEAEMCGHNILQKNEDDECIYLENGKCSIHETRPQVCRQFFCSSKDPKFEGMVKKVTGFKAQTHQ